jgi:ATP-dependent helicase HrpA
MEPSDKPLTRVLSEQLLEMTGVYIPEDAWQADSVDQHLQMNFVVLNEQGKVVDSGRSLQQLKTRYASQGEDRYHPETESGLELDEVTDWDFGPLPHRIDLDRGGITLPGFPALVESRDKVAVRIVDSEQNAKALHRIGLTRLFMLKLAKDVRYIRRNIQGLQKMRLQYAKATDLEGKKGDVKVDLEQELVRLIFDLTFIDDLPEIRDGTAFNDRIDERKSRLIVTANNVTMLAGEIFEHYQLVNKKLSSITQINWMLSLQDMRQQLDRMVFKGFLTVTPIEQLREIPRYLAALLRRLEKLNHAATRDQQLIREMQGVYQQWQERDLRERKKGRQDERLEEIRWSLEELRVSLFAQELKTAYPVSVKRIEKRWKALGL